MIVISAKYLLALKYATTNVDFAHEYVYVYIEFRN